MNWLRVTFHGTFLCLGHGTDLQKIADAWAGTFGPGYATGLLTIASATPFNLRSGTLFVLAPDNVTPDTFGFLATNWSKDCIVVDQIALANGPPSPETEQARLDADHPGFLDSLAKTLGDLGKSVVFLAILIAVVVVLVETGTLRKLTGAK